MTRCEKEAWLAVAVWSLLIYATIPVIRPLQMWIKTEIGSATFGFLTLAALAAAAAGGLHLVRRSKPQLSLSAIIWVIAAAAAGGLWTLRLWDNPEEAVHLVEYGLLALLTANALRHRSDHRLLFVQAAFLVAMVGTVDELIQWITPERYFDWRDIRLNAGAGLLALLGVWKSAGWGEKTCFSGIPVRLSCRLAASFVMMIGLCLCLTPNLVEGVAQRLPFVHSIADNQDTVVEYGHRHSLPGLTSFTSRFTCAELVDQDQQLAAEVGPRLRDSIRDHRLFLRTTSRARDPFLWEARLHLGKRNRNIHLALTADNEQSRTAFSTFALREAEILDRFFAETLRHARLRLGPKRRAELERHNDPTRPYAPRHESHVITWASQAQLLSLIALALAALAIIDRWSAARESQSPQSSSEEDHQSTS